MAAVNLWKRGSKRRVGQVRRTRWEILHALALALLMLGFSFWVGVWVATHHFD